MSTNVRAILNELTIEQKVELLGALLEREPDLPVWRERPLGAVSNRICEEPLTLHSVNAVLGSLTTSEKSEMYEALWAEVGALLPEPDWLAEVLAERLKLAESEEVKFHSIDETFAAVRKRVGLCE